MTAIGILLEQESKEMEVMSNRDSLQTGVPMSQIINEEQKLQLAKIGIDTFTLDPSVLKLQGVIQELLNLSKDYRLGKIEVFARRKPRFEREGILNGS